MKVIFEFDTHEDKDDLKIYQSAHLNHRAVYEVTLALRNYYKYHEKGPDATDAEHRHALEELYRLIQEAVEGLGYWDSGYD